MKTAKAKTIKIKGTEYKVKYSIRSLFIFEAITKKQFKIETLLDNYIFFYAMVLASNPDQSLDWDDFLDALDSDPTIFGQIQEIVAEEQKKNDMIFADEKDSKKKVKG